MRNLVNSWAFGWVVFLLVVGIVGWAMITYLPVLFPRDTRPYCKIVLSDQIETRVCPQGFTHDSFITLDPATLTFKEVAKP